MAKPTIDTESVAQDQLRAFFERWQRLEEEKRAVSDDLKELFAEAKAFGFHTKVMRKLFRDETGDYAERIEFEAVYELYAAALGTRNANARDAREDDDSDDTNSTARETVASTTAADPAGEADDASSADTLQEGSEPIEAHNLDRAGSTPAPATSADAARAPVEPSETELGDGNGLRLKGEATAKMDSAAGVPGVGPRDIGSLAAGAFTQREDDASPTLHLTNPEPEGASIGAKPSMASEPAGEAIGTAPASPVPGRQPGCLNPDTRAFMAVAAGGQAIVHQGAVS